MKSGARTAKVMAARTRFARMVFVCGTCWGLCQLHAAHRKSAVGEDGRLREGGACRYCGGGKASRTRRYRMTQLKWLEGMLTGHTPLVSRPEEIWGRERIEAGRERVGEVGTAVACRLASLWPTG